MKKLTPLEKLQAEIDVCNGRRGCNSRCSKITREKCVKLKKHAERMEKCREAGLPIELW